MSPGRISVMLALYPAQSTIADFFRRPANKNMFDTALNALMELVFINSPLWHSSTLQIQIVGAVVR
jgi:hypothetical protein